MIKKIIFGVIIVLLLAGNIFFFSRQVRLQSELDSVRQQVEKKKLNENIVGFEKLFIAKVLKAEGEIDFETRLELENAVRNLDDEEILNQWQKFIGSESEAEAQTEVKNLLEVLVNKTGN